MNKHAVTIFAEIAQANFNCLVKPGKYFIEK